MLFKELDILDFGNSLGQTGVLFTGQGRSYLVLHADAMRGVDYDVPTTIVEMSIKDWDALNHQLDNQLTEILQTEDGKNKKIVVRKGQRAIDTTTAWRVYERDDFRCRYCGRRVPLTVDHVDLWENGGVSVDENLISSCRKCNKERGNLEYDVWLTTPYYLRVSASLLPAVVEQNAEVVKTLPHLRTLRNTRYESRK